MRFIPLWLMLAAFNPAVTADNHAGYNVQKQHYVNQIHIEALDVFDPKIPEYRNWAFRFLNKLHNKTNDSFIRRELLFHEGDIVDDDLLEETERNLRAQDFLGDVSVTQRLVSSDKVDIFVNTEDQWTLQT